MALDLIWSIFDLAIIILFVFFFLLVIRLGISQLQKKWRFIAIPAILIGTYSLIKQNKPDQGKDSPIGLEYSVDQIIVPVSSINDLNISIVRGKEDNEINPYLSNSYLSGFVLGRVWKQEGIQEKDGRIEILGSVNYYLFGIDLMSFPRTVIIKPKSDYETPNFKHEFSS